MICCGCDLQHRMKNEKRAAERGQTPVPQTTPHTCAFCRTAVPLSKEKALAQLCKRAELKDSVALHNMAMEYGFGGHLGLPADQAKCIELLRESAGLGFTVSQYQLGSFHCTGRLGLEHNEEEAAKYWEEAAEGGHIVARHNLGCKEHDENGDFVAAMRHWRLSAAGGYRNSMHSLIACFEEGSLYHGDLAETVQAFYIARAEMTSEDRDVHVKLLKLRGEYQEEYES